LRQIQATVDQSVSKLLLVKSDVTNSYNFHNSTSCAMQMSYKHKIWLFTVIPHDDLVLVLRSMYNKDDELIIVVQPIYSALLVVEKPNEVIGKWAMPLFKRQD